MDTQLILSEIKLLREAMDDFRAELNKIPKRRAPAKRANPTREEVEAYAASRGRSEIAEKFYEWYSETNWHDGQGKPVINWKAKFLYWEQTNPKPTTDQRSLWSE